MKQLKQQLVAGLRQNPHIQIEREAIWTLPVQKITVRYEIVQQSKMDILMKMMLSTLQRGTFTTAQQLTEVLLVESLFIQHMIDKMLRAQVIEPDELDHYRLTSKGAEQLAAGQFIDQPEGCSTTVLYSTCHQEFFIDPVGGEIEQEIEAEYRHYDHFSDWEMTDIPLQKMELLLEGTIEQTDPHIQTIISSMTGQSFIGLDFIPCIEFTIHDWEQDIRYTKIWNTYRNEWDEVLAEQTMMYDREQKEA